MTGSPHEIVLPVRGMSCQKCVRKVTDLLMALDGVQEARVSLEEGTARAFYFPAKVNMELMQAALVQAGFRVPLEEPPAPEPPVAPVGTTSAELRSEAKRLSFAIRGMHCANCAGSIEKKLRTVPGVRSVRVSFAGETGNVTFDPEQTDQETIFQTVRAAGYQAALTVGTDDLAAEARRERNWLIFAAVLTAPIMPLMWSAALRHGNDVADRRPGNGSAIFRRPDLLSRRLAFAEKRCGQYGCAGGDGDQRRLGLFRSCGLRPVRVRRRRVLRNRRDADHLHPLW